MNGEIQTGCFTDILFFEVSQVLLLLTGKAIDTLMLRCCGIQTQLCSSGCASIAAGAAAIGFVYLRLSVEERRQLRQQKRKMRPWDLAAFVAMIFTIQFGCTLLFPAMESVLKHFGYSAMMQAPLGESPVLILYSCLMGPVAEELIYRGAAIRLRSSGKVFAIAISALLFGLAHGNMYQAIYATLSGLVLGCLAVEYSLKWAICAHIFNNMALGNIWPGFLGTLPDGWWADVYIGVSIVAFLISVGWLAVHEGAIKAEMKTCLSWEKCKDVLLNPSVLTLLIWNLAVIFSSFYKTS